MVQGSISNTSPRESMGKAIACDILRKNKYVRQHQLERKVCNMYFVVQKYNMLVVERTSSSTNIRLHSPSLDHSTMSSGEYAYCTSSN